MLKRVGINKFVQYLIIVLSISCSRVGTLNLNKHTYGQVPDNIIWLQIAGLTEEQIALIKFSFNNSSEKTSLEGAGCIGKMWSYNLYKLRPNPEIEFLAQITGRKNIKNSCEDYKITPVWDYFSRDGIASGVFEVDTKTEQSIENANSCEGNKFLEKTALWKMSKKSTSKESGVFHFQEEVAFTNGGLYFDKSCQVGQCYSTPEKNIGVVYKAFKKKNTRSIFIYRDFSLYNALISKDIRSTKEKILEIEKVYSYFSDIQKNDSKTLLLLTSASPQEIEFPKSGKNWEEFEAKGKFVNFRNAKLSATVLATGSGAENFCGFYNSSDLLTRLFWDPNDNKSMLERFLPL